MGMTDAFEKSRADFTGMSKGLFINDVIHKSYVKVDEAGTEAATETGVIMFETSLSKAISFKVDRPLVFIIKDNT